MLVTILERNRCCFFTQNSPFAVRATVYHASMFSSGIRPKQYSLKHSKRDLFKTPAACCYEYLAKVPYINIPDFNKAKADALIKQTNITIAAYCLHCEMTQCIFKAVPVCNFCET